MYPPVEASDGQAQYKGRSGWAELICTPHEASGGKTGIKLGLLDLSSDVPFSDIFP